MLNLSAAIGFHAGRTPEKVALSYRGAEITYAELTARTGALAAFVAGRGVGPDDVVAVFMKNSPAFLEIAIAAGHVGAVFLPINYRLATDEVAYILADAGVKLLFVDEELSGVAGGFPEAVIVDADAALDVRRLAGERPAPDPVARGPDDLFRLMYTSGTTDRPKGVMHTYGNWYFKNIEQTIALGVTAEDRILTVGPLYHVGAFDLPGTALLWIGGRMAIVREFDEEAVFEAIDHQRLTCAWFAPVMLGRLVASPLSDRYDLSSLKWAIGGGEKTPEGRIHAFRDLFPNGRYVDGYGLTETCSGDTLMEAGREIEKIGSTGRALMHTEVSIRDEAGNALPPDTEGEICVRGPKVTKGYWKDPEKTAASFHPGGWFRSGDVGTMDAEGFLRITDRKKDMILSGGENIASSEVERVIFQLPQVLDAAVIGVADPDWGERPVAVVVPKPGETLTLEALAAHCGKHLARFKIPRELHLAEELPRNPSGKVLKRALRERFAAEKA